MEDLKQIQEFFSKPLNEGKQLDQVDFAKVVKAVEQTGHPVTVLLVPKFNEIEVITGMDAPDDMLRDLSDAVDSLGYGRNDIFIAGDSSNLSRREYSDIRRVNGGHKDYFEESLNENEDPIIVKYFKRGDEFIQILVKYEKPVGFTTALGSRTALGQQNDQNEAAAQKRVKTIVNNLKSNFDLDDIFVEKGQVAGRYYINAFSDDFIDMDVNDLEGFFTLEESVNEAKGDQIAVGNYVKTQHGDIYKRVEGTVGGRPAFVSVEDGKEGKRKTGLHDTVKLTLVNKGELKENKKLTYNDFIQMVRDDMMAGSSPDEKPSDEQVKRRAKSYYNDYLQGASVDDLFEATKKEYNALLEYNTGLDYHPSKEKSSSNSKKSSLKKVKDMIKRAVKEGDITVDDKTEFKLNLKHLLDKHIIQKEDLSDYEETEADYNKLYSNYAYKAVKEVFEEKGFSKYLKSKDNPKGETDGLTPDVLNKILMNIVKDIKETIELGQNLNEELCPKGKAYIKKRQAAGEKSSAYLSGRAVKVCKGQMKG